MRMDVTRSIYMIKTFDIKKITSESSTQIRIYIYIYMSLERVQSESVQFINSRFNWLQITLSENEVSNCHRFLFDVIIITNQLYAS